MIDRDKAALLALAIGKGLVKGVMAERPRDQSGHNDYIRKIQ